jgi:hypothetical protein
MVVALGLNPVSPAVRPLRRLGVTTRLREGSHAYLAQAIVVSLGMLFAVLLLQVGRASAAGKSRVLSTLVIEAPFGGSNVFYRPNPTGWEEETKLLLAPQVSHTRLRRAAPDCRPPTS